MDFIILIAQAAPSVDAVGVTGWTSAGLLGLVLSWVFLRHIPEKDKQYNDLRVAKDDQLDRQRKEFTESLNVLTDFLMKRAIESAKRKGVIE